MPKKYVYPVLLQYTNELICIFNLLTFCSFHFGQFATNFVFLLPKLTKIELILYFLIILNSCGCHGDSKCKLWAFVHRDRVSLWIIFFPQSQGRLMPGRTFVLYNAVIGPFLAPRKPTKNEVSGNSIYYLIGRNFPITSNLICWDCFSISKILNRTHTTKRTNRNHIQKEY